MISVNPPSPYSVAAAVIACRWLLFIFDLMKILNPTGKAFSPKARGSNFDGAFSEASFTIPFSVFCAVPLSCLLHVFPSSKYCISGIVSALAKALNSRSALTVEQTREQKRVSVSSLVIPGVHSRRKHFCFFSYL